MDYQKVIEQARTCIGPYCKACAVCNGRACKNTMPGPGAKGIGDVAIRNFQKWQEIRINMDTICEKSTGSMSVYSRSSSGYCEGSGWPDEDFCGRRDPDRNGCL